MAMEIERTRRIVIGMLSAEGAVLFAALNMIGATLADNPEYAKGLTYCLHPLFFSIFTSIASFIMVEIADHPNTPDEGHPHSKLNSYQTANALIVSSTMGFALGGVIFYFKSLSV